MLINSLQNNLLVAAVACSVLIFYIILYLPESVLPRNELGIIETATALFYLAGFLICVHRLISDKTTSKSLTAFWCLFCFLFLGEETSWLQHYFQFGTPEVLEKLNRQGETNIHNLKFVTTGSWHAALDRGEFSISLLLGAQNLFRLGFFSYFIVMPLVLILVSGIGTGGLGILERFAPKWNLVLAIIVVMAVSVIAYTVNSDLRQSITESRELFYAFFIVFYVYFYLGEIRFLVKDNAKIQ